MVTIHGPASSNGADAVLGRFGDDVAVLLVHPIIGERAGMEQRSSKSSPAARNLDALETFDGTIYSHW